MSIAAVRRPCCMRNIVCFLITFSIFFGIFFSGFRPSHMHIGQALGIAVFLWKHHLHIELLMKHGWEVKFAMTFAFTSFRFVLTRAERRLQRTYQLTWPKPEEDNWNCQSRQTDTNCVQQMMNDTLASGIWLLWRRQIWTMDGWGVEEVTAIKTSLDVYAQQVVRSN